MAPAMRALIAPARCLRYAQRLPRPSLSAPFSAYTARFATADSHELNEKRRQEPLALNRREVNKDHDEEFDEDDHEGWEDGEDLGPYDGPFKELRSAGDKPLDFDRPPPQEQIEQALFDLAKERDVPIPAALQDRDADIARLPRNVQALYLAPMRHEPTHGITVAHLQLRSYSVRHVEFMADFALRAAYYLGLPAKGPVPLPRITERWTVPRDVFIFKKVMENFERVTLRRMIQIQDGHPDVVQQWLAFLRKWQWYGVGMKANVFEYEGLDALAKMDTPDERAIKIGMESVDWSLLRRKADGVDAEGIQSWAEDRGLGRYEKVQPAEEAKETPTQTKTESAPAKTQPAEAKAEPTKVQPEPVKSEPAPAKTQAKPIKTKAEPAKAQPEPVEAKTEPAKTQAKPIKTEAEPAKPSAQPAAPTPPETTTPEPTKPQSSAAPPAPNPDAKTPA